MAKTGQDSTKLTQVLKEEEYGLMCQFIADGLWSTSNLSRVVGVDRKTIESWKPLPEAQAAYRLACKNVLKKRRQRGDVEKELKELDLDVAADQLDINVQTSQWTDEQLQQFIEQEAARRIAG